MKIIMGNKMFYFSLVLLVLSCHSNVEEAIDPKTTAPNPPYAIDYFDEYPKKFFPNIISTEIDKFNTSFMPDGKTIFYTVTSSKLGITGMDYQKLENGTFSSPEFVPFISHDVPVADVQISPDGTLMLFSTFKDYVGKPEGFNFNIWASELKEGKWQGPFPIGYPIASKGIKERQQRIMENSNQSYLQVTMNLSISI